MTNDGGPDASAFVVGAVQRTALLGGLATIGAWWIGSRMLALAVAVGAGVGAGNLALLAALSRRMFDGIKGDPEDQSSAFWTSLLVGKMVLLLVGTSVLVLVFGIHPIGFAVGFTTFVAALFWAALRTAPEPGGTR